MTTDTLAPARPSARLLALCGLFVMIVGVAGYVWQGQPALAGLGEPPQAVMAARDGAAEGEGAQAPEGGFTAEQVDAMVEKLRQRLETEPDNAEGWMMLARSYMVLRRPEQAIPAYQRAIKLNPKDASLLADYADMLATRDGGQLDGEPARLIERALVLDPEQPKALALAGTVAFRKQDYAKAVGYWERILAVAPPDSEFAQQVRSGIDEARRLGKLPAAGPSDGKPAPAGAPARVAGTVTLAPALAAQARPDDTVFVFARAAEGGRAPLAVLRKQVKDLPIEFALDDSLAMSPQMKLSAHQQVVVGARISRSGNPMAQPGDLEGYSGPVALGRSDLRIEIAQAVKP